MNTKRFIIVALGGFLLAAPASLFAQQDQESVVEAAKKAQAEKKNAPKAKIVIDEDNLGSITGTINVVGQEAAPTEEQAKAGEKGAKAPAGKAPVKDEAYWRDKFAEANKKLADDSHELDIMQREYNLKQEQFYTDPTAELKQEYSRQDLNDTKAKIDDMTAQVAQDKQAISDLEDDLRKAGGDPGWAAPPAQPAAQPQQ
jgi:chromosome segregation ATPase